MRVLVSLMLVALLVVSSVAFAQDSKGNFSGKWSLNKNNEKGNSAKELIITRNGNNLSVQKVLVGPDGKDIKLTENFTLDGQTKENTTNGMLKKITANLFADGKSITISSTTVLERNGNKTEITKVETWKLSEGGNSLSIESAQKTSKGEMKAVSVYDKTAN